MKFTNELRGVEKQTSFVFSAVTDTGDDVCSEHYRKRYCT